MDIQQAKILNALALDGTMLGAAARLGITQPAVSASLGVIEKKLCVKLFTRSRRGLALTEHGREILPLARQMIEISTEIDRYGIGLPSDEGMLRVAGRQGFMQYVFPALMALVRKRYPKIHIEFALSGNQDEVIDALRNGSVDIAFAASPRVKSIHAEVFFQDPVWVAVSRSHPLARKKTVTFPDITLLPFCLPSKDDRLRRPIDTLLRKARAENIFLETNDYTLARNIISEGVCAGFIYAHMLTDHSEEIYPLDIRGFELKRDLTILHRRDDIVPHAETARLFFIAEAKKILTKAARRIGRKR